MWLVAALLLLAPGAAQTVTFVANASNANSLQERRVISSLVPTAWLKVLGYAADLEEANHT